MLRWDLQWSAAQKTWNEFIEQGKKLPPQYDEMPDRPDLAEHLVLLWNEFWELSTERQIGMAAGPIPSSKIRERGSDLLDLDYELDVDRFFVLIRKMDTAYLEPKPSTEEPTAEASDGTTKPIVKFARKKLPHKKKL